VSRQAGGGVQCRNTRQKQGVNAGFFEVEMPVDFRKPCPDQK
jgi:hypothetical protein